MSAARYLKDQKHCRSVEIIAERRSHSRLRLLDFLDERCVLRRPPLRSAAERAYVSIRQHTSAYVSIRQHTSAYVSIRQHTSAYGSIRQHMSAYVSIRQHTSACCVLSGPSLRSAAERERERERENERERERERESVYIYMYIYV
jgi:hypothetical protein